MCSTSSTLKLCRAPGARALFSRMTHSTSTSFSLQELISETLVTSQSKEGENTVAKQHQASNASVVGHAWTMELLRKKSWDDLHRLWISLYKERNALHAEKLSWKKLGYRMPQATRFSKVRLSMNRIKQVMAQRAREDSKLDPNTRAYLKAFVDAM